MEPRRRDQAGPQDDLVTLARLETEAAASCAQRARSISQPHVRAKLRELWSNHLRHVESLTRLLAHRGGPRVAPLPPPDRLPPMSMTAASAMGTHGLLLELLRDEKRTAAGYEALLDREWDRATRQVIGNNLADQELHIDWLEEQIDLHGRGVAASSEREAAPARI